ncbi:MAG: hypothetical protein JSV21_05880 [Nitrospirota bacterium]|nr:MAG: hypothetical protein JSV21_05880 [Nitrospirota bacterium]
MKIKGGNTIMKKLTLMFSLLLVSVLLAGMFSIAYASGSEANVTLYASSHDKEEEMRDEETQGEEMREEEMQGEEMREEEMREEETQGEEMREEEMQEQDRQ